MTASNGVCESETQSERGKGGREGKRRERTDGKKGVGKKFG